MRFDKSEKIEKYLFSVRDYCQQGIIEQPKLRDQTIAFYITICSAFIAFYENLNKLQLRIITIIMLLIGIICFIKIVEHRVWNIQYLKVMGLANGLLLSKKRLAGGEDIRKYIESHEVDKSYPAKSLFSSVGNLTAMGFSIITTTPFIIAVFALTPDTLSFQSAIVICSVYVVIYCISCGLYLLKRINSNTKKYMWLFEVPAKK